MSPQEKRRKRNRARERDNLRQRESLRMAGVPRAPHQTVRGAMTAFCDSLDRIPINVRTDEPWEGSGTTAPS